MSRPFTPAARVFREQSVGERPHGATDHVRSHIDWARMPPGNEALVPLVARAEEAYKRSAEQEPPPSRPRNYPLRSPRAQEKHAQDAVGPQVGHFVEVRKERRQGHLLPRQGGEEKDQRRPSKRERRANRSGGV